MNAAGVTGFHGFLMKKPDRIKEEIGWLKVVFAVCAAVDASLVAWLAQNFQRAHEGVILVGVGAAAALSVIIWMVHRRSYELIERLEEL